MTTATIHYVRPSKGLTIYTEDLIDENARRLKTTKTLPADISQRLTETLRNDGLIGEDAIIHSIDKVYFFDEPFNILIFRSPAGDILGHYSDIGEPVAKRETGEYEMTDLFLDIWLRPNGELLELDWDEFDEAVQNLVITPAQADLARSAMQRLVSETGQGIYPTRYLE